MSSFECSFENPTLLQIYTLFSNCGKKPDKKEVENCYHFFIRIFAIDMSRVWYTFAPSMTQRVIESLTTKFIYIIMNVISKEMLENFKSVLNNGVETITRLAEQGYETFEPFNDIIVYKKDGKEGLICLGTDIVTDAIFDKTDFNERENVMAQYEGEWYFIDENGNLTANEDDAFVSASPS